MNYNRKKIKVVHILNTGSYSGAENVVITIIKNLSNYIDATYISLEGNIGEILKENSIKYYPVKKLTPITLRKAFKDISPDIIHAHDYTAGIMSVLSGTHIPIINHIHNNSPWIKKLCIKSFTYGFSCLFYSRILTVSKSVMDEFVFGKMFKRKAKIVGNPIDGKRIRLLSSESKLNDKYDIIFLGRITEQKNPLLFVEIIKDIKMKKPDVKVVMIGDGELRQMVQRKIIEYNLQNNISILGFISNPYPYLANSSLMCLPSSWEGFGLVAVEALLLGKPVVCSGAGGLKDIIDGSCGMICTSINDYVDEIIRLLDDMEYYALKSDNAIKQSNILSNMQEYMRNLLKIYKRAKRIKKG